MIHWPTRPHHESLGGRLKSGQRSRAQLIASDYYTSRRPQNTASESSFVIVASLAGAPK